MMIKTQVAPTVIVPGYSMEDFTVDFYDKKEFIDLFAACWISSSLGEACNKFGVSDELNAALIKAYVKRSYDPSCSDAWLCSTKVLQEPEVMQAFEREYNTRYRKIIGIEEICVADLLYIANSFVVAKLILIPKIFDAMQEGLALLGQRIDLDAQPSKVDSITDAYFSMHMKENTKEVKAVLRMITDNTLSYSETKRVMEEARGVYTSLFYTILLYFGKVGRTYEDIIREGNRCYDI